MMKLDIKGMHALKSMARRMQSSNVMIYSAMAAHGDAAVKNVESLIHEHFPQQGSHLTVRHTVDPMGLHLVISGKSQYGTYIVSTASMDFDGDGSVSAEVSYDNVSDGSIKSVTSGIQRIVVSEMNNLAEEISNTVASEVSGARL